MVTESGEDVEYQVAVGPDETASERPPDLAGFVELGTFPFTVLPGDTPLVLGHHELTQICDWHSGDIDRYSFIDDRHPLPLSEGHYSVQVHGRQVDFDEVGAYISLRLWFRPVTRPLDLAVDTVPAI